jgi:hypothetical protein
MAMYLMHRHGRGTGRAALRFSREEVSTTGTGEMPDRYRGRRNLRRLLLDRGITRTL